MAENTHGSELRVGDGATPQTFTAIAKLGDFNLPKMSREAFKVTTHEDGGVRRLAGKVIDVDNIKGYVILDFNDPTHDEDTGLLALFLSGELRDMQIGTPADVGIRYAFSGFIQEVGETPLNVDGEMRLPFMIAVDDVVTIEDDN